MSPRPRRPSTGQPGRPATVYLVLRDDVADNNLLGVFDSSDQADSFSGEVADRFPDGSIIVLCVEVGYRYDGGTSPYGRTK
jgi:hypothetical protein